MSDQEEYIRAGLNTQTKEESPFKHQDPFNKSWDDLKDYSGLDDFRNAISPKSEEFRNSLFPEVEYYQVFSNKFGFIPNLSIVDLLFNEGLKSVDFLTQ